MQYKNPEKLLSIVEADESDLTVSGLVKPDILQARRLQLVVFYSEAQTSEQDKLGTRYPFSFGRGVMTKEKRWITPDWPFRRC